MSERLPCGRVFFYGLFEGDNQIGFISYANYTPKRKGEPWIYHFNRVVIHPDYTGFGLGIHFINKTTELMKEKHKYARIMGRFSSIPVFKALERDTQWKLLKVHKVMKRMKSGEGMERNSSFRDKGITSFSFEYFGDKYG